MRTKVPGVWIPDAIVDRLAKTPKKQKKEEGIQICIEIIQQVREIDRRTRRSYHGLSTGRDRGRDCPARGLLPQPMRARAS